MSAEVENATGEGLDRRTVLKKAALTAGAAAFATPIVAGVFSSRVQAGGGINQCTPEGESDAVDILLGDPRSWNLNCDDLGGLAPWGRYNAQRSEFEIPSTGEPVVIIFGETGTDNFPVQCSYFQILEPDGWTCTATFTVGSANLNKDCGDIGGTSATSGDAGCSGFSGWDGVGHFKLPYCKDNPSGGQDEECPSNFFLHLVEFYCCPT